jgi:hypothetical protein
MPELPKKITVDHAAKKLLVDGVEFPWYIAEGPTVHDADGPNAVARVSVTLFADAVEVVPASTEQKREAVLAVADALEKFADQEARVKGGTVTYNINSSDPAMTAERLNARRRNVTQNYFGR